MTTVKSCFLVCLQRSHEPIPLPHGVAVVIGRTPETRIIDPRCSRRQVELTADWSKQEVKVKQMAPNNTSIDGSDLGQSKEAVLHINSTLFILSGQYPHQVNFEEDKSDGSLSSAKGGAAEKIGSQNSSLSKNHKDSNLKVSESKPDKKSLKRLHSGEDQDSNIKKKKTELPSVEKEKLKIKTEKSRDKPGQKSESGSKTTSSHKNSSNTSWTSSKEVKQENVDQETSSIEVKQENADEESEHLKNVELKLKQMKQHAKHEATKTTSSKDTSRSHSSSVAADKFKTVHSPVMSSKTKKNSELTTEASWASHEHLFVFTSKGVEHRNSIAGFDIDGTIILTKSGKTFPKDSSDWKIAYPEIFGKLKSLHKEGHKIVFFTNQLGVARGKVKIEDLKTKIENIISHLHLPVQVFIATNSGRYRKPMDGMWRRLKSQYNGGISIDTSSSVYVGDAAGRPADWEPKKKKDFSCSDRLFALNIGVRFYTPEEFFLKRKPAKFNLPTFDPRALPSKGDWVPKGTKMTLETKEVIVLVGYPACGKSHFAKNVLKPKGYIVVNRDTLGTWQKCVKLTQESIVNSSVVVDNTNLTQEERARYIKCARQEGIPCRCFLFMTSIDHCRHNERFREMTDKSHAVINEMIFNKIKSSYQEPNMSEGFTEIVKISFVPKFSSSSLETDYRKFLLEK